MRCVSALGKVDSITFCPLTSLLVKWTYSNVIPFLRKWESRSRKWLKAETCHRVGKGTLGKIKSSVKIRSNKSVFAPLEIISSEGFTWGCKLHEDGTFAYVVNCNLPSPWNSAWHTEGIHKYLLNDRVGGRISGHLDMAGERWPAFFFLSLGKAIDWHVGTWQRGCCP